MDIPDMTAVMDAMQTDAAAEAMAARRRRSPRRW